MSFRLVAVATISLSLTIAAGPLRGQATEQRWSELFAGAVKAYAEYRQVPLDQVVVDSLTSGRHSVRGEVRGRARWVSVAQMHNRAADLGFHLGGDLLALREPGEFPPSLVSRPDLPAAKVLLVNLRKASPDSVIVSVRGVTASLAERVEWADLMAFTFTFERGGWTLVDAVRETGEMRRW